MSLQRLVVGLACAWSIAATPVSAGRPRPNPSGLVSHDFNATCTLLPSPYAFADPLGDASLALTGSGSGDAHLELAVPAGVAHDEGAAGTAPRVAQPALNANLDVVAKFDSEPIEAGQGQGLSFTAASGDLLRFELRHDGSSLRLQTGSFLGGVTTLHLDAAIPSSPSLFLRVWRVGTAWTVSHGSDGQSWTTLPAVSLAFAPAAAALFVRNAVEPPSASPAFTARVDYFHVLAAPGPVSAEDQAPEPPRTLTVGVDGSGTVQRDPDAPSYACGTPVLLTALPSPGYGFNGWSGSLSSTANPLSVTVTGNAAITAAFAPDGGPPVLSDIAASPSPTAASVAWTTDEPATTQVAYGLTPAYELGSVGDSSLVTSHGALLPDLAPDTTYHYQVTSADGAGQAAQSGDLTFTTLPAPTCTLDVLAVGAGAVQVDPAQPSYACGSDVLITALPNSGYGFTGWSGGATGTENPLLLTLSSSLSVTASFAPDGVPPVLSDIAASPSPTSALVTWTTSEPASSQVEYGRNSSYELGTEGSSSLVTSHGVSLGGLSPNRSYHYRVTSADGAGLAAQSGDLVFTTAPAPSGLDSMDWNVPCGALPAGWSFVDPVGDSDFQILGPGSGDAHLALSVPAGVQHSIWTYGANAPRVMHGASDADFEVEAKFDSLPTQRFQGQGLFVEASPGNHIRFEFYHNGSSLKVYSASFVGNTPTQRVNANIASGSPLWMRVARSGNQWTLRYSYDGSSWTQAVSFSHSLAVSALGVYALNDGAPVSTAPAWTALVDYVADVAYPIVPEDDPAALAADAKILAVDVTGSGTVQRAPDQSSYACSETVTLTAVPGIGQLFAGWSGDLAGIANPTTIPMDQDRSVGALFVPDTDPPVVSNLTVTAGETAAIVSWATSEPASSQVSFGPTVAYEDGSVGDATPKTLHSVTLLGLTPSTLYHFEASSTDGAGLIGSAGDATFTTQTPGPGGPSGIDSDDFSAANLNLLNWSFVDPLGDGSVRLVGSGTAGAVALVEAPGGPNHDVTEAGITAPRIRQPANDSDFTLEARFQSPLTLDGQKQGLLVEESATRYLKAAFEIGEGVLRLRATAYVDGSAVALSDTAIPSSNPLFVRLLRSGSGWIVFYSENGITWNPAGSFNHAMTATAVAVYAGNSDHGISAPAHTAAIDYFFEGSDPVVPEDAVVAEDVLPPLLQRIALAPTPAAVELRWVTDEPAESEVRFGLTPAYELGSFVVPGFVQDHTVAVPGLQEQTTYYFQVVSRDALGATSTSGELTATTLVDHSEIGPEIDVWYGLAQQFGQLGLPQPWANVVGHVADPDGVASLTYSVNGNPARSLRRGPDGRRLQASGDWNADVPVAELVPGSNSVLLRALDTFGNETTETVLIEFDGSPVSLPFTVDWALAPDLMSVSQPVDGRWVIEGSSVRNLEMGYDRLLALGDLSWTDYEVSVPVTIHDFDPVVFDPAVIGAGAAAGIGMRWEGHHDTRGNGPHDDPQPYGALGWYRIYPNKSLLEIVPQEGGTTISKQERTLALGVPHVFKLRVETLPGIGHQYSFKVWEEGQPEPPAWDLQRIEALTDSDDGSVLLVTHYMQASFGPVTVTPLP